MLSVVLRVMGCVAVVAGVVLAMRGPAAAGAAVSYLAASVDAKQRLHVTTADHRELMPPLEGRQVGFDRPAISKDHRSVGWLAMFPGCCTAYPLPVELDVFKGGRIVRRFKGDGRAIFRWAFEDGDTRVALYQDFPHGQGGGHFELRDLATGKLVARYDKPPSLAAPQWVRDVAIE